MEKQFKRVGTHSGRFHADEVMSTAILKELFDVEVIRSRDPEVLDKLDLIYDVGEGEFDHHQADKKYRQNGTPYAACGLIWDSFGKDVISSKEKTLSEEDVDSVFRQMDNWLIEGIDAVDNGVKTSSTFIPTMNISSIIAEFNPPWDFDEPEDGAFNEAVDFASTVFGNMLGQKLSVVRAKSRVLEAYNSRNILEILVLDRSYPWNRLLYEIDTNEEVLFVVFPKDSEYLLQTVRKNDGTYGDRKRLPASWAGKRDGELARITGVWDAVFCHDARFIASAKSLEGVLKMAGLALEEPEYVKKVGILDMLKSFIFRRFRRRKKIRV